MSNDHAELERLKTEINLAHTRAADEATTMTEPKCPAIEYDERSWEAGYQAGLDGKTATAPVPKDVTDELAYWSALIEGQADRNKPPEERQPQTHRKPPPPHALEPRRKPKEQG